MASKEPDDISPVKHTVMPTLVSEHPLAAHRKSMGEIQKLKRNKRSSVFHSYIPLLLTAVKAKVYLHI